MTPAVLLTLGGLVGSLLGAAIAAGITWGRMHTRVERAEQTAAHTATTLGDAVRQLSLLTQQVVELAKDIDQLASLVRESDVQLRGKVDDLKGRAGEAELRLVHLERSVDAIADHTGAPGVPRIMAVDKTPIRGVRG